MKPVAKTTLKRNERHDIGRLCEGDLPATEELAGVDDDGTDVQALDAARDHGDRSTEQRDNQDDEQRDNVQCQAVRSIDFLITGITVVFHCVSGVLKCRHFQRQRLDFVRMGRYVSAFIIRCALVFAVLTFYPLTFFLLLSLFLSLYRQPIGGHGACAHTARCTRICYFSSKRQSIYLILSFSLAE